MSKKQCLADAPDASGLPWDPAGGATVTIAGTGVRFACAPGDTILRAALRAGIGLPYECNVGACGTCKVDLVEGEVVDLLPEAAGIKPRDRDRGRRLACQTRALGSCTIKSRVEDSYVPKHRPRIHRAHLVRMRDITHDIRAFEFLVDGPSQFIAGQYAMITVAGCPVARAYSMSNVGNEQGLWEFMVRRVPGGCVSTALFDTLSIGCGIELDGPYGMAHLRESAEREIVCVAGGSGIAPMISILKGAATSDRTGHLGAWLFYGGRTPSDIPVIRDLLAPRHLDRAIKWHPVVSAPSSPEGFHWQGASGFVHELLPMKLPRPLIEYEYYCAGPPPMIEATIRMLVVQHGVPQSQLHFDRFF